MNIEIYGASWCHACKQAKQLCETNELTHSYIDIDDTENLRKLEEKLGGKVRSVPQIFLNGDHLPNGFTSLKEVVTKV
jgi:glutaredoxin